MVIGKIGDFQTSTKHSSLFQSGESRELKDDDGHVASSRPDISAHTYAEILQTFSNAGDWILFPKVLSGKLHEKGKYKRVNISLDPNTNSRARA